MILTFTLQGPKAQCKLQFNLKEINILYIKSFDKNTSDTAARIKCDSFLLHTEKFLALYVLSLSHYQSEIANKQIHVFKNEKRPLCNICLKSPALHITDYFQFPFACGCSFLQFYYEFVLFINYLHSVIRWSWSHLFLWYSRCSGRHSQETFLFFRSRNIGLIPLKNIDCPKVMVIVLHKNGNPIVLKFSSTLLFKNWTGNCLWRW